VEIYQTLKSKHSMYSQDDSSLLKRF